MIKSCMSYVDIIFPLSLGRLTYRCPEELMESVRPGMIVSAPLKNRITKGIIVENNYSPPPGNKRDIVEIHGDGPVMSRGMLELIQWMSDYYIATEGIVLKQTVPNEIFIRTRARKTGKKPRTEPDPFLIDVQQEVISPIVKFASDSKYQAFLIHSPSIIYEYSVALRLLQSCTNVIILVPEIAHAEMLYGWISRTFQDRACLLHSKISKGRRSGSIEGIISGKHDIVVGTRAALFAPLKTVSLIVVLHEHSGSYKLEEGIRYNIRDVAVMRGFLEKSAVVMSSVAPSIDSLYNAMAKKYKLIRPEPVRQPRIKIIDMRSSRKVRPNISRTVFESVRSLLTAGKKIMFVINRRGYSTLLQCGECGHTEDCGNCRIPLVMHMDKKTMKCHHCGISQAIPERCGRCRSFKLEILGSGTQKIQEDIQEMFGIEALRFDSDNVKKGQDMERVLHSISDESTKVIIGTKMMTRRVTTGDKFSAAVILNIDASLNFPDYRASEKAYAELASIRELIEPEGDLFIQTRSPQNALYKYFRVDDYPSFAAGELALRKELCFPPYAKLLNIRVTGDIALTDKMADFVKSLNKDVDVLGPTTINNKGVTESSILLKSVNRKELNTAARAVMTKYRDVKGINIVVDVDPA